MNRGREGASEGDYETVEVRRREKKRYPPGDQEGKRVLRSVSQCQVLKSRRAD